MAVHHKCFIKVYLAHILATPTVPLNQAKSVTFNDVEEPTFMTYTLIKSVYQDANFTQVQARFNICSKEILLICFIFFYTFLCIVSLQ